MHYDDAGVLMQNIRVQCLVACADDVGEYALLTTAKDAMDASCKLPAGYDSPWPQLVVATLDINQGEPYVTRTAT